MGIPGLGARPPVGFPGKAPGPVGGGEVQAVNGWQAGNLGAGLADSAEGDAGAAAWVRPASPPLPLPLSPFFSPQHHKSALQNEKPTAAQSRFPFPPGAHSPRLEEWSGSPRD